MNWIPFIEVNDRTLGRGAVFRVPASYPYESIVDFMLIVNVDAPCGMSLLVASGFKSGLIHVNPPIEAKEGVEGISTKWLKENWNTWVNEAELSEITYLRRFEIETKTEN